MSMTEDEIKANHYHKINLRDDPEYRSNFLNQMIIERIAPGGDCYPWTPDNVAEALANSNLTLLTEALKNKDGYAIILVTSSTVEVYWNNMAKTLCERELDK